MLDDVQKNNSKRSSQGDLPDRLPAPAMPGVPGGTHRPRILLAGFDGDETYELRSMLDSFAPHVIEAASSQEAIARLNQQQVDLVIADSKIRDIGGDGLCKLIRGNYRTNSVPVILISDPVDVQHEVAALRSGADDFLVRALNVYKVRARVQAVLFRSSIEGQHEEFQPVLLSLSQAVEARDPVTGRHCQRVALITTALGSELGLPPSEMVTLQRGAFLHDVGKIAIPDEILFKRGPLTAEEWTVMENHTVCGESICAGSKVLKPVLPIIRNHHERWDGSGYPDRLRGEDIPPFARMIQLADIFEALTTDRPYKAAFTPEYARNVLAEEAKAGWRDPVLVEAFCDIFPRLNSAEALASSSLLSLALALQDHENAVQALKETGEVYSSGWLQKAR